MRKYEILIDQPKLMGGDGEGPTPMEVNLASLLSCENVTARFYAAKKDIEIGRMKYKVTGHFNPKKFVTGSEDGLGYWEKVEVECLLETDASQETLDELKEMTHERCPVASLFHATEMEITSNWKAVNSESFEVQSKELSLFQKMMNMMMKVIIRDNKKKNKDDDDL